MPSTKLLTLFAIFILQTVSILTDFEAGEEGKGGRRGDGGGGAGGAGGTGGGGGGPFVNHFGSKEWTISVETKLSGFGISESPFRPYHTKPAMAIVEGLFSNTCLFSNFKF